MSNEEAQDRHVRRLFFWGGESILRGLKPGLLHACNDRGLAFDNAASCVSGAQTHFLSGPLTRRPPSQLYDGAVRNLALVLDVAAASRFLSVRGSRRAA